MTDETPDDSEARAEDSEETPDAPDESGVNGATPADAEGGANPATTEAGERVAGSFLVTEADEGSVLLRDVTTSRVHPLSENPGLTEGAVVEGVLESEPPIGATWTVAEHESTREIPVEAVDLAPTTQSREIGADQPTGELTRVERAGDGELHVITVPEADTDDAVRDVVDDETTVVRAARFGVDRVEVRSEPGLVVVRYLPD